MVGLRVLQLGVFVDIVFGLWSREVRSALRNERFGSMLEKISDPRISDAMMQMQRNDGAGIGTDHGSVFAAYGENG